jgi:hypothetical protein
MLSPTTGLPAGPVPLNPCVVTRLSIQENSHVAHSPEPNVHLNKLSKRVAGLTVSHVQSSAENALTIHFTDGSALTLSADAEHVIASLRESRGGAAGGVVNRPSSRQREYIDFIRKFTTRYGVPPSETDMARHFLLSAPSVNQMVKTLERCGYITRERGPDGQTVPRSIRIVESP